MFCTRCGSPNDEAAEYCRNCAEPLAKPGRGTAPFRDPTPTAGSRPRGEDPYPGYQAALPPEYQPYQPYQSPPAAYTPPLPASPSGRALTAMILSLVSIVTCGPLLSIPGLVLGKMEMNAIREGRAPQAGENFARVGFYLGIAVTALSCIGGIAWLVFALIQGGLGVT
jgi:hypothetical protein